MGLNWKRYTRRVRLLMMAMTGRLRPIPLAPRITWLNFHDLPRIPHEIGRTGTFAWPSLRALQGNGQEKVETCKKTATAAAIDENQQKYGYVLSKESIL